MPQHDSHGRFVWHELLTNDKAAAKEFYTNVVGWTTQKWEGAMDYTMWMAGETPIGGLMDLPADAAAMGAPPNWLTYIEVDDVNATVEKAKQLGGAVLADMTLPDVGHLAVMRDPQGAVFAVIESARKPGEETDPQPLGFSWHELMTTDHKAAFQFYSTLFGWDSKREHDMGKEYGIYHVFGHDRFQYGGMMNKPPGMQAPSHWMPYIQVRDSADAAAERATQAGGKVINGPMEVPGGDRIAALLDPQGAAISVQSKAPVGAAH